MGIYFFLLQDFIYLFFGRKRGLTPCCEIFSYIALWLGYWQHTCVWDNIIP